MSKTKAPAAFRDLLIIGVGPVCLKSSGGVIHHEVGTREPTFVRSPDGGVLMERPGKDWRMSWFDRKVELLAQKQDACLY